MTYAHPYTTKFWYPSNVAEGSATYSVTLKAAEHGNSIVDGRNIQISRTRAGRTLIYDRGRNINNQISLQFKAVPDSEKSALVVFLGLVGWGGSKIKYKDSYGTTKVVRCISDRIDYSDTGLQQIGIAVSAGINEALFDFNIDILDLTNSPEEYEIDPTMANALALHIADTNSPHSPLTTNTLAIADGTKTLETASADSYKTVLWIVSITNGTISRTSIVTATHNGTSGADATTIDYSEEVLAVQGNSSPVTLSAALSGAGVAQVQNLRAATTSNGWTITARRIKL
jgi:hypothetical protein